MRERQYSSEVAGRYLRHRSSSFLFEGVVRQSVDAAPSLNKGVTNFCSGANNVTSDGGLAPAVAEFGGGAAGDPLGVVAKARSELPNHGHPFEREQVAVVERDAADLMRH